MHMLKCVCMMLRSILLRDVRPLIVIELPTDNTYWSTTALIDFLTEFQLRKYDTVGCEFGLKAQFEPGIGMLMKKPWTLATNSGTIGRPMRRVCTHEAHEHTPCEGKNTLISESYPPAMAEAVHEAFRIACHPVRGRQN